MRNKKIKLHVGTEYFPQSDNHNMNIVRRHFSYVDCGSVGASSAVAPFGMGPSTYTIYLAAVPPIP